MNKLILITLCAFVSVCAHVEAQNSDEQNSAIIHALLPAPQSVVTYDEEGINPLDIKGLYATKKVQLPDSIKSIKSFPYVMRDTEEGSIQLETDRKIQDEEEYELTIQDKQIRICARTSKGLLYGLMTLEQLARVAREIQAEIPALQIKDKPYSKYRAIHLDLKHHIDKKEYMYHILDKMASYKLNAAIVEFEDKIKYETYPVIGAPNAWSIDEWKKWCEYAHRLNIEVSPLIQGIGHADYILKHEEMKHLRENPASDWVCCPSNEDYYKVQFSLYADAIKATPHGKYLHVGGDEVGTLGTCPLCKKQHKNALELQMKWLKRVSDYAVKHGRTPIFWDDMVFKQAGLYPAILDQIPPQQVDSVWNRQLPELDKHIQSFPKEVIYMRWQYGNANQPGNKKALKWYHDHKLKTMGATAAQTTFAMMPLGGFVDNIKSFQLARKDIPIEGVLCTAWDDASPLSDTFWQGFIAHAQYSWNIQQEMPKDEFDKRYRINEFGYETAQLPNFRPLLESTFALWETGLLDEGVRRALYRTGGKFKLMSLPTPNKGEWSRKYQQRLEEARSGLAKHQQLRELLSVYRNEAVRNEYSIQVFECINDLTGYTAELLYALAEYDQKRDFPSLNNLKLCVNKFDTVRQNMENVYSQIRVLGQPEGYLLPMNYHSHLAIQTTNSDWMFWYENKFVKLIKDKILSVQ